MSTLNSIGKSSFWSIIGQYGKQIITLVVSIPLARLLSPSEFGVVALTTFFIQLSNSIIDSGFSLTIIKEREDPKLSDSVFTYNLLLSVFISVLLVLFSKKIAAFYENHHVENIVKFQAIYLLINSLSIVNLALVKKRLQFKLLSKINIISTLFNSGVSLLLAYFGYSFWSIVIANIVSAIVTLTLLVYSTKYKPKLTFEFDAIKKHLRYSLGILWTKLSNTIFENSDTIVIGKIFGEADLGNYNKARSLSELPQRNTSRLIGRVLFSNLSKNKENTREIKSVYIRIVALYSWMLFPVYFIIYLYSSEIVELLYGKEWLFTAYFLRYFVIISAIYPFYDILKNILFVYGESVFVAKVETFMKISIPVSFYVAYYYSSINFILYFKLLTVSVLYFIFNKKVSLVLNYNHVKILVLNFTSSLISLIPLFFLLFDKCNIVFVGPIICCVLISNIISYKKKNVVYMNFKTLKMLLGKK